MQLHTSVSDRWTCPHELLPPLAATIQPLLAPTADSGPVAARPMAQRCPAMPAAAPSPIVATSRATNRVSRAHSSPEPASSGPSAAAESPAAAAQPVTAAAAYPLTTSSNSPSASSPLCSTYVRARSSSHPPALATRPSRQPGSDISAPSAHARFTGAALPAAACGRENSDPSLSSLGPVPSHGACQCGKAEAYRGQPRRGWSSSQSFSPCSSAQTKGLT